MRQKLYRTHTKTNINICLPLQKKKKQNEGQKRLLILCIFPSCLITVKPVEQTKKALIK